MESLRPNIKLYKCSCQKLTINSKQLSKNLRFRKVHKITIVDEELSRDSENLKDDEICKHIKYLRLFSNVQNNRLNLCFACKIFKSLIKITKTQLFIE